MNFYPFHIGDYLTATRHLSWDEDLAYRRLIDLYYTREAPLPLDRKQVYRLVVAADSKQRTAVDAVISEFFTEAEDGFHNARCDEELTALASKRDKAKQSADARWKRNGAQHSHSDGNANASDPHMRTHSEGNATNTNTNTNKDDGIGGRLAKRKRTQAVRHRRDRGTPGVRCRSGKGRPADHQGSGAASSQPQQLEIFRQGYPASPRRSPCRTCRRFPNQEASQ